MGIFSFLRSSTQPTPDLFEKELVELELKIQKHQDRLKAIDQRQRSTTSTITIYSSLFWAIYSSLWYLGWTPIKWTNLNSKLLSPDSKTLLLLSTNPKFNQALQVLPIILIPIGLISLRWLVQTWYQRKQESEKLRLRLLQKQLRDKVEELKKKTAYYSTKELLDRYDEKTKLNPQSSPSNPHQLGRMTMTPPNNEAMRHRQRPPSSSPANLSSTLSPIQNNHPSPAYQTGPPSTGATSSAAHQQLHQKMSNSPSPSIGRGWADRFAEVLLGDDEARPESKYALICINCFAHNGLVRQEELDHIQYLCPKCGTFNPSKSKGIHQKHPSGTEAQTENSQGKRAGRKSLADSMIRRKPPIDDLFNVTDSRRVVSSVAGVPSTSTSSLSLDQASPHPAGSNGAVMDDQEGQRSDQEPDRPDSSLAQLPRDNEEDQVLELDHPITPPDIPSESSKDRKLKKKSSGQKAKQSK
ncbi:hypothetical protein PGT21_004558 [Puccinia graminis f. sp. tritici]|uniref:Endoplasmic reticulum junction formation protein lunapark n=1 Tax=Puccinia graminis f. sp. tritici TaxID=56615 RepID=A0A5B0QZN3_PUCGR|nr:hypothetical protein PGT21_004558 [Puccinia graminis f. sp. tritici]